MTECALYRHWDARQQLLYVGISITPLARLSSHKSSKWFRDIARVDIEWFPSEAEALQAEAAAINSEQPIHNAKHNGRGAVKQFVRAVGSEVIAAHLGVTLSAVRATETKNSIPCSWARVVAHLCRVHGATVPISAFTFKNSERSGECITTIFEGDDIYARSTHRAAS